MAEALRVYLPALLPPLGWLLAPIVLLATASLVFGLLAVWQVVTDWWAHRQPKRSSASGKRADPRGFW